MPATTGGTSRARAPLSGAALLREAGLAALVAFALALPLIGFRTVETGGRMGIATDFSSVIAATVVVFIGRAVLLLIHRGQALPALIAAALVGLLAWADLAWLGAWPTIPLLVLTIAGAAILVLNALTVILRGRSRLDRQQREVVMDRFSLKWQQAARYVGPVLILLALVMPFSPLANRSTMGVAIVLLTYIMLAWGLNIIVGLAGLLDLGYVAFYAVGAYSYALLSQDLGLGFWVCLPLAGMIAACAGILLGVPVLRLRGDYFAIVTLGFGEIVRIVLINWADFTGGPNGLSGIPRPSFFGFPFERRPPEGVTSFHQLFGLEFNSQQSVVFLYYVILVLALLVNVVSMRLRRLPLGRAWEALREDDIACQALGINRTNIKLAAFMTSAMFGGFAGAFFASYQMFISPESFSFSESAIILAIVVLGGMGSQLGIVLATFLIIGVPELIRGLDDYRVLAFGAGMVAIMIWRPRGLLAHREPTVRLNQAPRPRPLPAGQPGGAPVS